MTADGARTSQWIVDALGEATATVEVDGKDTEKVPRWLLPIGTREGDVLEVERRTDDERVTLTVRQDRQARETAREASEKQMKEAPVDRKGGDIAL